MKRDTIKIGDIRRIWTTNLVEILPQARDDLLVCTALLCLVVHKAVHRLDDWGRPGAAGAKPVSYRRGTKEGQRVAVRALGSAKRLLSGGLKGLWSARGGYLCLDGAVVLNGLEPVDCIYVAICNDLICATG